MWWCGGHEEATGGPEVWSDSPMEAIVGHGPAAGRVFLPAATVMCSACLRMAPETNGCRYVEKHRLEELRAEGQDDGF